MSSQSTQLLESSIPFLASDITAVPDYCHQYDGVLLISQGDRAGAAGTIFYLFILNQLLYAEQHNLQPWIHLSSFSRHVYDPQVHGTMASMTYQFPEELDLTWDYLEDDPQLPDKKFQYPGKPRKRRHHHSSNGSDANNHHQDHHPINHPNTPVSVTVQGSGVWNSYFESMVRLQRGNQSFEINLTKPCQNLPLLRLESDQALIHGLHLNCPYCVRSWKYGGLTTGVPSRLREPANNYHQWWEPMRITGHRMVSTYYHLQPALQQLIPNQQGGDSNDHDVVVGSHHSTSQPSSSSSCPCLAVHIRHSDKANRRTKIPLEAFLPYCQVYVQEGGCRIYVATDSSRVLDKIQAEWPLAVRERLVFQSDIVRSANATAVFDISTLGGHHHRTNTEVLVDIAAMAKCHWILHGLSAVSEAAIYTNPILHQNSVNLEFYSYYKRRERKHKNKNNNTEPDAPMSIAAFRSMLQDAGLRHE